MIVSMDTASPVPPYEQVRSSLAAQINDRTLPVGTKLPTVRKLAADLAVAPNTIARAYRELEEAGLIETRGRAGSFVGASGDQSRQRAQEAAAEYAAVAHRLGLNQKEALSIVSAALSGRQARTEDHSAPAAASGSTPQQGKATQDREVKHTAHPAAAAQPRLRPAH